MTAHGPPDRDASLPSRFGLVALIGANLIVALLAAVKRWGYYETILIYWCEAVIVGGYNVLRLLVVGLFGDRPFGWLSRWVGFSSGASRLAFTLFGTGFFALKFGGFALAVGVFVVGLPAFLARTGGAGGAHVAEGLRAAGPAVGTAVVVLVLSHGFSFVRNFLVGREYGGRSILGLIFWPYARMALVALVLGVGLVFASFQGAIAETTAFAVAMVLVKLAADAVSHVFEHRRFARPGPEPPGPER